jgi:hypothetical protein
MLQHRSQTVAGILDLGKASFEEGELLRRQSADGSAGRPSTIAHVHDARELVERETQGHRAPHEAHPGAGLGRILPVAVRRPHGGGQQPLALVVAQRIGADSRETGQLGGTKSTGRAPRHRRPSYSTGSFVPWSRIWKRRNSWTASSAPGSWVDIVTTPPLSLGV